jgi:RNA polymerase sigma-70 factor (sigma-E family)
VDDADFADYATARWPDLVRAAVFMGCSVPDAQDLVQTALLRCFLSWRRVSQARDRDAYVYKILVNCLKDSRRRLWRREVPTTDFPEQVSSDTTLQIDISDAVERALGNLGRANRDVVVLRYLAGLTEQQTSEILGIPIGTVKSRTARALTQLARNANLSAFSGE